ncbi:MAG: hypothetical protein KDE27_17295, partial [Planctomycetes bacterium]|nr:hypothetical protein [Planctomycetota bacterium]
MATDDLAAASDHALAALGWNRGPGGELAIDGVGVAQLAAEFGTPLYVFCAATLARRIGAVQDALGPRVELLYSIKSNPS